MGLPLDTLELFLEDHIGKATQESTRHKLLLFCIVALIEGFTNVFRELFSLLISEKFQEIKDEFLFVSLFFKMLINIAWHRCLCTPSTLLLHSLLFSNESPKMSEVANYYYKQKRYSYRTILLISSRSGSCGSSGLAGTAAYYASPAEKFSPGITFGHHKVKF